LPSRSRGATRGLARALTRWRDDGLAPLPGAKALHHLVLAVITGATGLLGGNLAIELIRRGHRVRATRREGSKASHLSAFPIEWVSAELSRLDALAAAFAGADVVFHCAAMVSILKRVTDEIRRTNVDGTAHVIEAVRRANVARLVHCSTVGAVGLSEDGRPSDETALWNFDRHGLADGYVTTKHLAEELVRAAAAEGLDAVIANPTYMLGPYDAKPSSGKLITMIARGRVPAWTTGINNFVDVRDVARGMILVFEKGRRGERYILGGENLTYRDIGERIAREAGVAPPRLRAPRWALRLIGMGGDLIEAITRSEPLANSMTVAYADCTTFQFTSEKAKRELGYAAGPIEPAIRDAIAWFKRNGML
jgi:dihydroflavonol-4-reductase